MKTPTLTDTIDYGKQWLRKQLYDGAECPLCTQHAKVYRRKINSGMARSLIHMYRINGRGWVHVSAIGARSREEGKLAYWGLLEEQTSVKGLHGGRAGYWRVTPKGELFLRGRISVEKYALVYNGRFLKFEGGPVMIRDALGTKFDYDDLMQGV